VSLRHISGLDNFNPPHPNLRASSLRKQANAVTGTGSGPGGTLLGKDFRVAYVPGVSLTGAGQVVGLLEFDGYNPSDIAKYLTLAGLPDVPLENVLVDGFSGVPSAI